MKLFEVAADKHKWLIGFKWMLTFSNSDTHIRMLSEQYKGEIAFSMPSVSNPIQDEKQKMYLVALGIGSKKMLSIPPLTPALALRYNDRTAVFLYTDEDSEVSYVSAAINGDPVPNGEMVLETKTAQKHAGQLAASLQCDVIHLTQEDLTELVPNKDIAIRTETMSWKFIILFSFSILLFLVILFATLISLFL